MWSSTETPCAELRLPMLLSRVVSTLFHKVTKQKKGRTLRYFAFA